MKRVSLFILYIFISSLLFGQNYEDYLQNYKPTTPAAFQFTKYTDMPVSEYTGIPQINIPLFDIKTDGISVPVNLSYHAAGIRVNQEASWVGLGWDLQFGSIIQEINDVDDYLSYSVKKQPDYLRMWDHLRWLPMRWISYPNCVSNPGNGWSNPFPIENPAPYFSYKVATAYYMPINGDFDDQLLGESIANQPYYDSEPDVFTANFLGHSIKFALDFQTGNIRVFDNAGYKVYRVGDFYKIIVPSGEEFEFLFSNTTESYSTTEGGLGGGGGSTNYLPSSRIWMLTKIITKNRREVNFNYNYTTSSPVNNFPNYSERWNKLTAGVSNQYSLINNVNQPEVLGITFQDFLVEGTAKTTIISREKRYALTSITFPNGSINFNISGRNDVLGGSKLEKVEVLSDELIKHFLFDYSYFDASAVGGNGFPLPANTSYATVASKRLKLLSLHDNTGLTHGFSYNTNPLPPKNSFAQDYWGFYNGQGSNSSLTPNPARLVLNRPDLGNNGNNNSAVSLYAQSGLLSSIRYPTGGFVNFEYDLNQFTNYWVPDFSSTTNVISTGNGLRVKSISYYPEQDNLAKKTLYTYVNGKSILPLDMHRVYHFNYITFNYQLPQVMYGTDYQVDEFCMRGFFNYNSLASINSVGYDKVIRRETNANNTFNGKIETEYYNTPDNISGSANSFAQICASLPVIKNIENPRNGSIKSVSFFSDQKLLKKVRNSYSIVLSPVLYGAKIFGMGSRFYREQCVVPSGSSTNWTSVPQTLIGYYPIFDIKTLLLSSVTEEYDDNDNSISSTTSYTYNSFDQVGTEAKTVANQGVEVNEYSYSLGSIRPAEKTDLIKRKQFNDRKIDIYSYKREFVTINNRILNYKLTTIDRPGPTHVETIIDFDNYDNYGNLVEFTSKGMTKSMIWDYNGEYVVAEVTNSVVSDIAATSFEAQGKGNFNFNGIPVDDMNALTGKKVYNLTTGGIERSDLNSNINYTVTYWLKTGSGTCMVNGDAGALLVEKNGWKLYSNTITSTGGVSVQGDAIIDELRCFPASARMTTYTYSPLIGMTSQCDNNNRITYYNYDAAKRLFLIRDSDKNILKRICYNFEGQPEDCQPTFSTLPWWTVTGETRCMPCEANNNYPSTIRERKEQDLNPNSQSSGESRWVSDGPGTCISPPDWQAQSAYCEQIQPGINTGNQIVNQVDANPCSQTFGQARQIIVANSPECPTSEPTCNVLACEGQGPQYKCIRGVCEAGVWSVIKSTSMGKYDPRWSCKYAYCFSDGTISSYTLTVIVNEPCNITCY